MADVAIGNLYRDTANRLMLRAASAPPGVGLGRPYRDGSRLMARIAGDAGILKARPYRDTANRLKWRMAGESICVAIPELYCQLVQPSHRLQATYQIVVTAGANANYIGTYTVAYDAALSQPNPQHGCRVYYWRGQESGRTVYLSLGEPRPRLGVRWEVHLGGSLVNGTMVGAIESYANLAQGSYDAVSPMHQWWLRKPDELGFPWTATAPPGRVYVDSQQDTCGTMRCLPNALQLSVTGCQGRFAVLNGSHRMVCGETRGADAGYNGRLIAGTMHMVISYWLCNPFSGLHWIWEIFENLGSKKAFRITAPSAPVCGLYPWMTGTYTGVCAGGDPLLAGASATAESLDLQPT